MPNNEIGFRSGHISGRVKILGRVYQRAREREKVPAVAGKFCFSALCTRLSRMFMFFQKELDQCPISELTSQSRFLRI